MEPLIPFNKPYMTGKELFNIAEAHFNGMLAGDGPFTKKCQASLEELTGTRKALLTHSCTAALEMAALLCDVQSGDAVIMPSYTFVSTANAFVLRGARPIFVDIQEETLNIDPSKIEAALTPQTRGIVAVHYAGAVCDMAPILEVARSHGLWVIEDAAQGIMSSYRGCAAGTLGDMGTLSFHETKNIISGEGGALLVNRADLIERAEIIREKGTNRSQFFRGAVDKYTWCDLGSSYLPGELTAAFLWAQLSECGGITHRRLALWGRYHEAFEPLESRGKCRRPVIPRDCVHNAHLYYLLLEDLEQRTRFIDWMRGGGIQTVFHYVPLHSAPYVEHCGWTNRPLPVTESVADRIVRLPLWLGLEPLQQRVIDRVLSFFSS
ncbi:MAG TPA: dTDP-4-amino-4,6-dideoxygalactose transaminase [Methylococcaceae bacterium]|nr:dTDP-4-amino-4,6-dideoxygalactose transaminase [Methylococcaceae bacterium]